MKLQTIQVDENVILINTKGSDLANRSEQAQWLLLCKETKYQPNFEKEVEEKVTQWVIKGGLEKHQYGDLKDRPEQYVGVFSGYIGLHNEEFEKSVEEYVNELNSHEPREEVKREVKQS